MKIKYADNIERPFPTFMEMDSLSVMTKAELLAEATGRVIEVIEPETAPAAEVVNETLT